VLAPIVSFACEALSHNERETQAEDVENRLLRKYLGLTERDNWGVEKPT